MDDGGHDRAGGRLRVLFVCSFNQWRSPTAERLFRDDPRCEARSAGVSPRARRRVGPQDLDWADLVFVMESSHRDRILQQQDDPDLRSRMAERAQRYARQPQFASTNSMQSIYNVAIKIDSERRGYGFESRAIDLYG